MLGIPGSPRSSDGQIVRHSGLIDEAQDSGYKQRAASSSEPSDAWLKVRYRGAWYYIPATDLNSRTSFTLLNALFAPVVGEVPGAKPVLTLPVN